MAFLYLIGVEEICKEAGGKNQKVSCNLYLNLFFNILYNIKFEIFKGDKQLISPCTVHLQTLNLLPDSKPHSDFFAPHHTLRMVQRSVLFLVCTACLLKKLLICLWLLKPPYLLSCSRYMYGISDWSKFIPHVLTMCMINNLFSLVARMATKLLRLVHDKKKEAAEGGTCTCRSLTKNKLQ